MLRSLLSALCFLGALTACSPTLNWRESVSAEGKFSAVFPGKPKVSARDIALGPTPLHMSMTAAGQGPTLFAVGVAPLPAQVAATPEASAQMLGRLRDALLTNVGMTALAPNASLPELSADVKAMARSAMALRAQRTAPAAGSGPTQMSAHLIVANDRLYQIVALGDAQLSEMDLETFFGAFRLLP